MDQSGSGIVTVWLDSKHGRVHHMSSNDRNIVYVHTNISRIENETKSDSTVEN